MSAGSVALVLLFRKSPRPHRTHDSRCFPPSERDRSDSKCGCKWAGRTPKLRHGFIANQPLLFKGQSWKTWLVLGIWVIIFPQTLYSRPFLHEDLYIHSVRVDKKTLAQKRYLNNNWQLWLGVVTDTIMSFTSRSVKSPWLFCSMAYMQWATVTACFQLW